MEAVFMEKLLKQVLLDFFNLVVLTQALAVALCVALAWVIVHVQKKRLVRNTHISRYRLSRSLWSRGGFPILAAIFLGACDFLMAEIVHGNLLSLATTSFFAMAVVRILVYAVHRVFVKKHLARGVDKYISVFVWAVFALHALDLLGSIQDLLSSVVFPFGKARISLLGIIQGVITTLITLLISLWVGAAIEARLMRWDLVDISVRAVINRLLRAFLMVFAILLSMSLSGIDLTVLSVFGGALGVGLGLGMQRIASNYVSGFIILLDRSVRIGQPIAVDKYSGVVQEIKTRYTVLRADDGTKSILPNETLVNTPVFNTAEKTKVLKDHIRLLIRDDSEPQQALMLMLAVAKSHEQVVESFSPAAQVLDLPGGHYLIELSYGVEAEFSVVQTLRAAVRSDLLMQIAQDFRNKGIHFQPEPNVFSQIKS
jgi:small-conductance mechanosensitive channel